jgi:TonB-linked SusC/RagA family outer membrane protein
MIFNAIVGSFIEFNQRTNAARTKMLRVMKLTALIALVACLQASAHGIAQDKITFSGEDVPLEKVLSIIKKQTSYLFLYNDALLENARKVTLHVKNATVEEVLNACFKDQPLNYAIKGKTIFIISRQVVEKKEVSVVNDAPPGDDIKGRITNAAGEPLGGANIVVKSTGKGTQANANGEFTLKSVGAEEVITITYTGYAPQTVKVGGSKNLMLVMKIADNELDEMVVQGYGTTTRRLATGNIAKVTAAEIERQPVMNPLLALQGKVAGLEVTQINGYASAPIKVELRGRSSIGIDPSHTFPSDPLYIIDGVPLTVNDVSGSSSYTGGSSGFIQSQLTGPAGGQSPLFSLNPSDIESIEVLKDADATAIYGSRGANGVILITTKRGKAGKSRFNINAKHGVTMVTRYYDMLNTQQYLSVRREAFKNDNIKMTTGNAYDLLLWDTTHFIDWQRKLYGKKGLSTNVQMGLSGGDQRTTFRIGAGYNRVTSILRVSGADQKGSLSFNVSHKSLNQKMSIALTGGYSFTKSDMISLPGRVDYAPDAPDIFDSIGNLNYAGWKPGRYPFASLKQPYIAKTNFLNTSLVVGYQILKGLSISTSLGYNNAQANQEYYQPISSKDPATNPTGSASFGFNNNNNWIIEPQLNYDGFISKGQFSVLVGGSEQQTNTSGILMTGNSYTNDALLHSISNALTKDSRSLYGLYKYSAIFGRLSYNWLNKYILNVNARRDGSSRFGPGSQFGNFGSIGVAWTFTEEGWVKKLFPYLSFGKLRASYGTTGSDAVSDYQYLSRWSSDNTIAYGGIQPIAAIQHSNPNYRWQINRKLEGALDATLFNNRLNLAIVYYRNRCGNQLISFPTPEYTGFTNVTANSTALVQNEGWEFTSSIQVLSSKKISWSFNFNSAINKNKLISYPNFSQSPFVYIYSIGQPLNISKVLHNTGVDPLTGRYSFLDQNKDGRISTTSGISDDRWVIKKLAPDFFGGLGTNIGFAGFQLSLFFNIKRQIGKNVINLASSIPGGIFNLPLAALGKHWQKPGDVATIAKYSTQDPTSANGNYTLYSDGGYTDASFIRLSNASLSYSLPSTIIKKVGLYGCSIFINANNLFIITKYKGIDPETMSFGGMPPSRTIVGGVSLNF